MLQRKKEKNSVRDHERGDKLVEKREKIKSTHRKVRGSPQQ
jgi:hypothetical protein